ncbi:MAG: hypothetical protein ABFR62_00790 [Bacteroidota bacterium]
MITWKGRGIFSILILFVTGIGAISLFIDHIDRSVFSSVFILSGIATWGLGKEWSSKPEHLLIERETEKKIISGRDHSLYNIKVEYLGILEVILGIAVLFTPILE